MHYYPHGLLIKKDMASGYAPENKFQYEGKKMQDELGLQLYDFHARQYDPQIGRFWGVDPADQFPSGYTGKGNDPANLVDPSGMVANGFAGGPGGQLNAQGGANWSDYAWMSELGGKKTIKYRYNGTTYDQLEDIPLSGGGTSATISVQVFTEDGKYLGTIGHGRSYAYILNKSFNGGTMADIIKYGIHKAKTGLMYDLKSFSDFYDKYGQSTVATMIDGVNVSNMENIRFNGKAITPRSEVIAGLVENNGIITVGNDVAPSDDMMNSVPSEMKSRAISYINTHSVGEGDLEYHLQGLSFAGNRSLHTYFGPAQNDLDMAGYFYRFHQVRYTTVDNNHIYLYNGTNYIQFNRSNLRYIKTAKP